MGFAYAFKVYWSPLVDRIDVPLLGRLGRRRGWMLLCQILVTFGLLGMAAVAAAMGFAVLTARASPPSARRAGWWQLAPLHC